MSAFGYLNGQKTEDGSKNNKKRAKTSKTTKKNAKKKQQKSRRQDFEQKTIKIEHEMWRARRL